MRQNSYRLEFSQIFTYSHGALAERDGNKHATGTGNYSVTAIYRQQSIPDNVKTNEWFESSSIFPRRLSPPLSIIRVDTVVVIISPFPNSVPFRSVPYARPNGFMTVVVNSNSWEINICGAMRIHARMRDIWSRIARDYKLLESETFDRNDKNINNDKIYSFFFLNTFNYNSIIKTLLIRNRKFNSYWSLLH